MSYTSPWSCPRCGAPVRFEPPGKDETTPVEECVSCEWVAPFVTEARLDDIPAAVETVTKRRLMRCGSCLGHRHWACIASKCECPCRRRRAA